MSFTLSDRTVHCVLVGLYRTSVFSPSTELHSAYNTSQPLLRHDYLCNRLELKVFVHTKISRSFWKNEEDPTKMPSDDGELKRKSRFARSDGISL